VLCDMVVTGQPARLFNLFSERLSVAEPIITSRSPLRRHLIDFTVSTAHSSALSMINGDIFDNGLPG